MFSPLTFDVTKFVFSLPPDTPNHEEYVDLTTGLFLEKFLSFGCFDSCYFCVLKLRGVFVTAGLEVGYEDLRKHTISGLSDTFQTTDKQSDFHSNHR